MNNSRAPASEEAQEVLAKMISLSTPPELPKNLCENHLRIWEAFEVGRAYELALAKESKKSEGD